MNLDNVKGVIFDMDGLLVDSERLARDSLIETALAYGVASDVSVFTEMIGLPEEMCVGLLHAHYGKSFLAHRFIEAASTRLGAQISAGNLRLKAGAAELVSCLQQCNIKRAVATSSHRKKAMETLAAVGFLNRFNVVVTRSDVTRGKPSPDLFLRAASELGLDTDECIALEDSYNGIRAASHAGIRVVMVPDLLLPTSETMRLCEDVVPDLFYVRAAFLAAMRAPGARVEFSV